MASTSAPSSTATERTTGVRLSGIYAGYDGSDVLDGLSLELGAGTTVLLGPNGSGKSTLLSLLAGRLHPTAGAVETGDGRNPRRVAVGYAAQHPELDPEMTGRELLRLFGALAGRTRASLAADVDEAIALFSLDGFVDLWVSRMSGGMRRRLHLAISTLGSPTLWLLDEPTTGLDPHGRSALEFAMRAAAERGAIVFFSTHDLAFAERVSSRVVLMDRGRWVADSTTRAALVEHGSFDALYASIIGEPMERPLEGTASGRGRGRGRRHG